MNKNQQDLLRVVEKMTDLIAINKILIALVSKELGISDARLMQLNEKAKTELGRSNLMLRDDLSNAA